MQSTTEAEIWSALLSLCDLLKNAVCIPCPINDNFKLEVSWSSRLQQLFIAPWPFSDPHSTTSLFTDPLDGPNDQWGSISTTVRTAGLEGLGVVHKWRHTLTGVTRFVTNCDKGEGGLSSFVMSHESFWYACYTHSYQQGKVWRPKCFYCIYSSFLLPIFVGFTANGKLYCCTVNVAKSHSIKFIDF